MTAGMMMEKRPVTLAALQAELNDLMEQVNAGTLQKTPEVFNRLVELESQISGYYAAAQKCCK